MLLSTLPLLPQLVLQLVQLQVLERLLRVTLLATRLLSLRPSLLVVARTRSMTPSILSVPLIRPLLLVPRLLLVLVLVPRLSVPLALQPLLLKDHLMNNLIAPFRLSLTPIRFLVPPQAPSVPTESRSHLLLWLLVVLQQLALQELPVLLVPVLVLIMFTEFKWTSIPQRRMRSVSASVRWCECFMNTTMDG